MAVCGICFGAEAGELFLVTHERDPLGSEVEHVFHKTCLSAHYISGPAYLLGKCPFDQKKITRFNGQKDTQFLVALKLAVSARDGNLRVLNSLLQHNDISEKIRSLAILEAVQSSRSIACIKALLDAGPIAEGDRTEIVRRATICGSSQIVRMALDHGEISALGRIEASLTARFHKTGDWQGIVRLLDYRIKTWGWRALGISLYVGGFAFTMFHKMKP